MTYPATRFMRDARRADTRNRAARMEMTIARAERVRNARIDAEADALARERARDAAARDRRHRAAEELAGVQSAYELHGREGLRPRFEVVRGRVVREPPLRLTRDQVRRIAQSAQPARPAKPAKPVIDDTKPGWFERAARAHFAAKYGRLPPRSVIRTFPGTAELH